MSEQIGPGQPCPMCDRGYGEHFSWCQRAEPAKAICDQPPPTANGGDPIWDLVIADMKARDNTGRQRYGTPLQAFNGRLPLVDAFQEALDLSVYLRQAIVEWEAMEAENERLRCQLIAYTAQIEAVRSAAENASVWGHWYAQWWEMHQECQRLRLLTEGLAAGCAGQSELIASRAEKQP